MEAKAMMYDYLKREQELATGCPENPSGLGTAYDTKGNELRSLKGVTGVEFPNAGSQSYGEVFRLLGYPHVFELQMCSSAGDWDFLVSKDRVAWSIASQENRYPMFGFRYFVGPEIFTSTDGELTDAEVANIYEEWEDTRVPPEWVKE